ncbi:unnamed protein product [Brassicogethes aeneus]|uniref:Uncharacterized protein n=1 Tax=Brassicogethes aeneus TaxID=1431903 RepID=A0A9P0FG97_BRAAE|nr:unnamed protein product [Brassicogethes aeneus]
MNCDNFVSTDYSSRNLTTDNEDCDGNLPIPTVVKDETSQASWLPKCHRKSNLKKKKCQKSSKKKTCFNLENVTIENIFNKNIEIIKPEDVQVLVEKENEDIELFSGIARSYIPFNPGNFSPKKKLHKISMNSEAMALLYESVFKSTEFPSADSAQIEPTPELMASIMHLIENKIDPLLETNVHFNTLFTGEKGGSGDDSLQLSPLADGYYQDVIIPLQEPKTAKYEMLTRDNRIITARLKKLGGGDLKDDLFKSLNWDEYNMDKLNKSLAKTEGEDSFYTSNNIGAEPITILDAIDINESTTLKQDLQNGIQYFIETTTPKYYSRIQLRGSEPPQFFPGYIYATSDIPESVKLARSPSEVFEKAWMATHPKYFRECSLISL